MGGDHEQKRIDHALGQTAAGTRTGDANHLIAVLTAAALDDLAERPILIGGIRIGSNQADQLVGNPAAFDRDAPERLPRSARLSLAVRVTGAVDFSNHAQLASRHRCPRSISRTICSLPAAIRWAPPTMMASPAAAVTIVNAARKRRRRVSAALGISGTRTSVGRLTASRSSSRL